MSINYLGLIEELPTGSSPITGALTETLVSAALTANVSVIVAGALGLTTGNATLSSAGTVLVSGALTATTAGATLSGSGTVGNVVTGTLAATTGAAALSAAGTVLVSGTLNLTTGAATLSATGSSSIAAQLSATTGAAALSAAGTVRVSGALSSSAANATLSSAGGVLVSGALNRAADNVGLSATGTVVNSGPVTGTLTVTLANAVLLRPFVPPAQSGIPAIYKKGVLPIIPSDTGGSKFAQRQFDQLFNTLSNTLQLLPQAATQEPDTKFDGMKRLARRPWWPVAGQGADAWVYWDAAGKVWRLLTDAPTTT